MNGGQAVQDICRRRKIALERIHVEGPALVQRLTINVRTEDLLGNSEFNDPPPMVDEKCAPDGSMPLVARR
jgi:hypothetical protein